MKLLPTRCRHGCTCCGSLSREPTFEDTRPCNRVNLPVWFGNTVRCTTLNTHQSELYKLLRILCVYGENRLFNNLEKRNFLCREREREREREEDDLLYFWKATRFLFSFECFFHRIFLWFKHLQPPARNYDSPQAIADCCRRKITSQRNFIAHQDPVTTKFLIWGILIQRIRRKWLKKCSWENDRADRCQVDRIFIILLRDLYRLFGINLIKLRSS